MSVHLEISKKIQQKLDLIETYKKWDQLRESKIEEVIAKCKEGNSFSVEEVNIITRELNQFASKHHLPSRKLITEQMVMAYVNRT